MRTSLTVLFCLIFIGTYSQIPYLGFVQTDKKIQWAAEYSQVLNITPDIRALGIKQLMLHQLKKKGYIKEYEIVGGYILSNNIKKLHPHDLSTPLEINPFKQYLSSSIYDDSSFINKEKKCDCESEISQNNFDIYNLDQLLFYKDSKLFVKNVLVTPLCLNYITEKEFTWNACISTCYDNNRTSKASPKKRWIDYGNSEQTYNLMYDPVNARASSRILSVRNPQLARHLLEDIMDKKITAVDDSFNIIPGSKILQYKNDPVTIPVYDSTGEISAYQTVYNEINVDSFYEFGINQHFYLDTINNVLHSEVNYIDVYRKVITSMGVYLGKTKFFRIYFIKPSLYVKPKMKRFLED